MKQPDLIPVPELNNFRLCTDYVFEYETEGSCQEVIKIVVPRGFTYDGASIPMIAQVITYTPFHPKIMAAALIHDWLYLNHQVNRLTADRIFEYILKECGVPEYTSYIMFKGVRLGGELHYKWDEQDHDRMNSLWCIINERDEYKGYNFPEDINE